MGLCDLYVRQRKEGAVPAALSLVGPGERTSWQSGFGNNVSAHLLSSFLAPCKLEMCDTGFP
jgi:hypothetical protein